MSNRDYAYGSRRTIRRKDDLNVPTWAWATAVVILVIVVVGVMGLIYHNDLVSIHQLTASPKFDVAHRGDGIESMMNRALSGKSMLYTRDQKVEAFEVLNPAVENGMLVESAQYSVPDSTKLP